MLRVHMYVALTAVAALLLCWVVLPCEGAAVAPARVLVGSVGGHSDVFAEAYEHDIIRLLVKPKKGQAYETEHVVATAPLAVKLGVSCARFSTKTCTVSKSGNCELLVDLSAPAASAKVVYRCSGAVLSEHRISSTAGGTAGACGSYTVESEFPQAKTMYGLAEHAADLPLRQGNTYRLANTDAFQYPVNSTARLYGSIPFIMAYSADRTTGVLLLNPSKMDVAIPETPGAPAAQWRPECGIVDLFLFPGPTPAAVQRQHSFITGASLLPPYFSLGFHQCRWNYVSTKDCLAVDESFDAHGMPYDALWLDIEHLDAKKAFTWDTYSFPSPPALTDALAAKGRKLVTVRDPHVKRDGSYHVHREAEKGGHYVKQADGSNYVGKCWPGLSSWPDFMNTRTRDWYATFYHDDRYPGGGRDVHTWVDMNEPSVFEGDDGSMHGTAVHTLDSGATIEHRYVHNMYALVSIMSAYKGALEAAAAAAPRERPFILTRGFFPGSQRYAAMWTGDNFARWDHLENAVPELLSLSLSNYAFVGSDVGGFFGDTDEELFVRWVQLGVFTPFFRAHAHMETKRREPYTFSPESRQHIRNALGLRYALLPYLYTTFFHAHTAGEAVMRALVYDFPEQEGLREEQHAFLLGPSLLVRPVVEPGAASVTVVLPANTTWYDYRSGQPVDAGAASVQVAVGMGTIPLFVRGGHIVPMKLRLRRSTAAARRDPFTLYVALDAHGWSRGDLYLDDGTTFDYQDGAFMHRRFTFENSTLTCWAFAPQPPGRKTFESHNTVERVIVLGAVGDRLERITLHNSNHTSTRLDFERVGSSAVVVRKPGVAISADWEMTFEYRSSD